MLMLLGLMCILLLRTSDALIILLLMDVVCVEACRNYRASNNITGGRVIIEGLGNGISRRNGYTIRTSTNINDGSGHAHGIDGRNI